MDSVTENDLQDDESQRRVAMLRAQARQAERLGDLEKMRSLEEEARAMELALRSHHAGFQ